MKRRVLNSEATVLHDNRYGGIRQTVIVQVVSAGNVFISTQQNDLQQLNSTGSPVNGLKLSSANSIADGKFEDFLGVLWARSDTGADVEIFIHNSPRQYGDRPKPMRPIPFNAPNWGNT